MRTRFGLLLPIAFALERPRASPHAGAILEMRVNQPPPAPRGDGIGHD